MLVRWLLSPLLLLSAIHPAHSAQMADVSTAPPFAAAPALRLMAGDAIEFNTQLQPPPPRPRNRLRSNDGSLDVAVGTYSDCTGMAEVTHDGAAIDTCLGGRLYFIGHNPGPFTPLRRLGVGSQVTYFDDSGVAHTWRIIETRTWSRWAGSPPLVSRNVVAQFQTCITPDGNWDEILDAVRA